MDQKNTEERREQEGVRFSFGDDCRRVTDADTAFSQQFDRELVILKSGEMCCLDDSDKMLVTVVGSGICLTIFDQKLYFGVMVCPLMTPEMCAAFPNFDSIDAALIKKAMKPIDEAIAEMKKRGAGKNRIRIRLFGGANLPSDPHDSGTKNYVFVKEYLKNKNLAVMGEDIGGTKIRRVHFLPDVGTVTRFALSRGDDLEALQQGEAYYYES